MKMTSFSDSFLVVSKVIIIQILGLKVKFLNSSLKSTRYTLND